MAFLILLLLLSVGGTLLTALKFKQLNVPPPHCLSALLEAKNLMEAVCQQCEGGFALVGGRCAAD